MHNSFKENYIIYKNYHNNIYNIYIHKITIPLIILASFILLSKIKLIKIHINIMLLLFYISYYFYINLYISLYANSFYILLYIISNKLIKIRNIRKISFIVLFTSSSIQILGHLLLENNRPVLMYNLKQSILMAPIFIFI